MEIVCVNVFSIIKSRSSCVRDCRTVVPSASNKMFGRPWLNTERSTEKTEHIFRCLTYEMPHFNAFNIILNGREHYETKPNEY